MQYIHVYVWPFSQSNLIRYMYNQPNQYHLSPRTRHQPIVQHFPRQMYRNLALSSHVVMTVWSRGFQIGTADPTGLSEEKEEEETRAMLRFCLSRSVASTTDANQ